MNRYAVTLRKDQVMRLQFWSEARIRNDPETFKLAAEVLQQLYNAHLNGWWEVSP